MNGVVVTLWKFKTARGRIARVVGVESSADVDTVIFEFVDGMLRGKRRIRARKFLEDFIRCDTTAFSAWLPYHYVGDPGRVMSDDAYRGATVEAP